MNNGPFTPLGKTYLVDSSAPVQVLASTPDGKIAYRVRNTSATVQSFGWAIASSTPTITVTAATVGSPASNVVSMLGSSIELFTLPPNAWFQAGAGASFEIVPGEGN